jgi:hypothetical protein
MSSKRFTAIVERIIRNHGPVIDLRSNPEVLLEVLRELGSVIADDPPYPPDNPCGGVPPSPGPPPPGPSGTPTRPTNDDIMRAVLKISHDLAAVKLAVTQTRSTSARRAAKGSSRRR